VSETSLPFEPAPQESLRLVANPFLAMSGLLLWFAVMQLILSGAAGPFTILAVLLALASLALLPALLHYHCLPPRGGPALRGTLPPPARADADGASRPLAVDLRAVSMDLASGKSRQLTLRARQAHTEVIPWELGHWCFAVWP
jgi:hypothetical protein